jgi:asparagine synthase (glutamine-hydrolysing)
VCGIAGIWQRSAETRADRLREIVTRMVSTIEHRGPDDQGTWVDEVAGIALGSCRLAIIDLSPEGHQPMLSQNGRYLLVFNGEIYNFAELRSELQASGHAFRGHSDTEVMLAAIAEWGVTRAVGRFNGMFAFAVWDREKRCLHIGRDRLGEKPLYYCDTDAGIAFGSELKALRAHPDFVATLDADALKSYFRRGYVPSPLSIYSDVRKLPPGTVLTFAGGDDGDASPVPYWSARDVALAGTRSPFEGTPLEAVDALEALLADAVRMRLVADVPIGAFLSGGIDSSTVVACMQAQSHESIKTFSVALEAPDYNEADQAAFVARHIGTDHTQIIATAAEIVDVIPKLTTIYDEPFADPSQIPTFLVSQLARRTVTVSLSGDGGDELFGGYNRYLLGGRLGSALSRMPRTARRVTAAGITAVPPGVWDRAFHAPRGLVPTRWRHRRAGDKLHKLAGAMAGEGPMAMFGAIQETWPGPIAVGGGVPRRPVDSLAGSGPQLPTAVESMMYEDLVTYLPDDILVKLDRASMGVSLEARVPLLDHRIVEFAWRLPAAWKIRNGERKWVLRQVLSRYIPTRLVDRPKTGFAIDLNSLLRGQLREWAEALLDNDRLTREGFLEPAVVRRRWAEHLSGRRNWGDAIWAVLMFEAWLDSTTRVSA